jgi:hypothetical protein
MKRFIWVKACSTVASGQGINLVLSGNVSSPLQHHYRRPLSATWQADWLTMMWFSWSCSTGTAWGRVSRCAETTTSASRQEFQRTMGKMSSSGLNATCSARWTERWRASCMASSVAGSKSNGFFFPESSLRLKEHVYAAHRRTIKISLQVFKQLWQRSIPTCQGVLERKPWGARPSALKLLEADSNTYRNYEAPMVDHLIACAIWRWRVSWKLNITRHTLYNIFGFFQK